MAVNTDKHMWGYLRWKKYVWTGASPKTKKVSFFNSLVTPLWSGGGIPIFRRWSWRWSWNTH